MNLTWLDLSFNAISKIEGLDKLTNLTDLSLFCNHIEKIENLQTLTNLSVLSIGEPSVSIQSIQQLLLVGNTRRCCP